MIKLIVEPYCEDCGEFEPDVDKNTRVWNAMEGPLSLTRTTITCVHAQRCACIKRYLNETNEGELND